MSELIEINNTNKQSYQAFLSEENGSFLQSWQWGEFKEKGSEKVLRFALQEQGKFLLTAQIIENTVLGKRYFFLPQGPTLAKEAEPKVLLDFLEKIKLRFPEIVFIRLEPGVVPRGNFKKTINLNPHQTLILDLKADPEIIFQNLKQKTRYNIKVAQKHQVEIKINENVESGIKLIIHSSKRAGVRAFSHKYYSDLLNLFSKDQSEIQARLYSAEHQGQIIAANLMIFQKNDRQRKSLYLFGGSSDFKRNLMAPYLLHWQAINDAKKLGLEQYDFWGVETDPTHPWYGFSKFKLGFGGALVQYGGTWDYPLKPAWYNGYRVLRKLNRLLRK